MGEPVVEFVVGDLFLLRTVGLHPPDMHLAGAIGIEINPFAIGRVVGAVVEAFGGGEPRLRSASRRNSVDVELAIAFAAKRKGFSIGRPAMPIGRRLFGETLWVAAGN